MWGQDLNLRPQGYEPCELPGCSTPHYKRAVAGNLSTRPLWLVLNRMFLAAGVAVVIVMICGGSLTANYYG
jgi:hypothetical protein